MNKNASHPCSLRDTSRYSSPLVFFQLKNFYYLAPIRKKCEKYSVLQLGKMGFIGQIEVG